MPNSFAVRRRSLTALDQAQICAFGALCRFVPPDGVYELLKRSLTSLFRGFAQLHVLLSTCNLPGCQWVEQGAAAFHQLRCCGIAAMSSCRNAAIRFRRFACCASKAKPCVPLSTGGTRSNIDFGDPPVFLCLRVPLPVQAMGLCLLKAVQETKDKGSGNSK